MASIAVFTQSNSVLFDDEKINRDKIPLLSLDSSLSTASSLRTSGFFDKENDEYNRTHEDQQQRAVNLENPHLGSEATTKATSGRSYDL